MVEKKQKYEPLSGVTPLEEEAALKLVDRVIEKIVRVQISDGRTFLGILMSVDQQRTVYIQDALELIDKDEPGYFEHD